MTNNTHDKYKSALFNKNIKKIEIKNILSEKNDLKKSGWISLMIKTQIINTTKPEFRIINVKLLSEIFVTLLVSKEGSIPKVKTCRKFDFNNSIKKIVLSILESSLMPWSKSLIPKSKSLNTYKKRKDIIDAKQINKKRDFLNKL